MSLRIAVLGSLLALLFPLFASAFPFGGQIYVHQNCYNVAIFAGVGPPRGGQFIWSPATRTYQFGPPRAVGQWLLGLASAPYYCVVSIFPLIVWPGIHIDMMGSSGAPASISLGTALNQGTPAPTSSGSSGGGGSGSGGGTGSTRAGSMLIGEVFAMIDASHGSDPQNEWVELYNGSGATVNLAGWRLVWGSASTTLPSVSLDAGQLIIVSPSATTRTYWNIPTNVEVVQGTTGSMGANGLVQLINPSGTVVDAVSWGSNTGAFSPAAPSLRAGHSLVRTSVLTDSDQASDWSDRAAPSPGN